MPKTQQKKIKAWAVMGSSKKPVAIEICRAKPTRYTIGTWQFFAQKNDKDIIPCTITFSLPLTKK